LIVPFTLSHPAAVLPLRTWTPALPFTALVIGSMAPDAEYYLPFEPFPRHLTHAFVGVPTVDLIIGLVTLIAVRLVLAAPVAALVPRPWSDRIRDWGRAGVPRGGRQALLVVVALIVGSATHVGWDAFTHINGQVVVHVTALRDQAGHYPIYQWLQLASSVFGLVVIGISLWRHRWWGFEALSPEEREAWAARSRLVRAVPLLVVLAGVVFAVYRGHRAAGAPQGMRFLVITGAGEGLLIAVGIWAVAYWAASSSSSSRWRR
jgi:Domain of unknown function (DUF4184)